MARNIEKEILKQYKKCTRTMDRHMKEEFKEAMHSYVYEFVLGILKDVSSHTSIKKFKERIPNWIAFLKNPINAINDFFQIEIDIYDQQDRRFDKMREYVPRNCYIELSWLMILNELEKDIYLTEIDAIDTNEYDERLSIRCPYCDTKVYKIGIYGEEDDPCEHLAGIIFEGDFDEKMVEKKYFHDFSDEKFLKMIENWPGKVVNDPNYEEVEFYFVENRKVIDEYEFESEQELDEYE